MYTYYLVCISSTKSSVTLPPTMYEESSFPTFSPVLVIVCFCEYSHSSEFDLIVVLVCFLINGNLFLLIKNTIGILIDIVLIDLEII